MPNTIARIIKSHSDKTKPALRRLYYESAKAHFDELVRQGDPYAKTLRRASREFPNCLVKLIKRQSARATLTATVCNETAAPGAAFSFAKDFEPLTPRPLQGAGLGAAPTF
jgi:hypothetical protein